MKVTFRLVIQSSEVEKTTSGPNICFVKTGFSLYRGSLYPGYGPYKLLYFCRDQRVYFVTTGNSLYPGSLYRVITVLGMLKLYRMTIPHTSGSLHYTIQLFVMDVSGFFHIPV